MSNTLINFASGVAKSELILYNNATIDTKNVYVGTGDISLNQTLSQYVQTSTSFSTFSATVGNGISFSGWFYPSGIQSIGNTLFHIIGNTTSASLFYDTSSMLVGVFNNTPISSSYIITPNKWHFFCYTIYCTINGNALQTLYIDPSYNTTISTSSGTFVSFISTNQNYIGNGVGNIIDISLSSFSGKIDDFRFYNRVLTSQEINVLYNYNYSTSSFNSSLVSVSSTYSAAYSNAVIITFGGIFSGLNIVRNPAFSSYDTCGNTMVVTCKDLISTNGVSWSFVDTSVNQNTNYTYTITPYVIRTYGNPITISNSTTFALQNGFFTSASALPSVNNTVLSPTLNSWTIYSNNNLSKYYLCSGTGTISSNKTYSGVLPSSITYYVAVNDTSYVTTATTTTFTQNISLFQNTTGFLTFYAWAADASDGISGSTLSVSFGGKILLNSYSFTTGTAIPYSSFVLPYTFTTSGTYSLVFSINNVSPVSSTICFAGIQMQSQLYGNYTYSFINPSMLTLYYSFDNYTGYGLLSNFASGSSVSDASLVGSFIQTNTQNSVVGSGYLYSNGINSYAKIGNWTCPTNNINNGFTITGWYYPTITSELSGSTLYSFSNNSGGNISLYTNPGGYLDFSCNGVNSANMYLNTTSIVSKKWNMITMTCSGRSDGSGNFNYYINDACMGSLIAKWPNVASSYTKNYVGGVPYQAPPMDLSGYVPPILGYFAGYIDEFRVYNRVLTQPELNCLLNINSSCVSTYANVIDMTGANFYYTFQ